MAETVLLVGNGINTISDSKSWESLLILLHKKYYNPLVPFSELKQKPFPLVYEQIVLWQLRKHKNYKIETELKKLIAVEAGKIAANSIHSKIAAAKGTHIITANYEFNLMMEKKPRLHNLGCVKETTYSIFRNFEANNKTHWHLHGDIQNKNSINLGYEHYCGQLQRMREYVTGVYAATDKTLNRLFKMPLVNRSYLKSSKVYSWIDLFFKDNTTIKIIGFRLELEELDIWWLLTYRAKIIYGAKKGLQIPVRNKIQYFIPRQYTIDRKGTILPGYKTKKELMEGMNIEVIEMEILHSEAFYLEALRYKT